ncbi:hypothetical protein [Lacunimicrobium album]
MSLSVTSLQRTIFTSLCGLGLAASQVQAECPCNRAAGTDSMAPVPMSAAPMSTVPMTPGPMGPFATGQMRPMATMRPINPMGPTSFFGMRPVPMQSYDQVQGVDPNIVVPQPGMFPPQPAAAMPYVTPPSSNGFQYFRTTRMIPANKPPRVAMVDIYTDPASTVRVFDIHPFREQDEVKGYHDVKNANLWVFETKTLYPGLPHIYKVVSTNPEGIETVKFVRLVPGRVVDVEF